MLEIKMTATKIKIALGEFVSRLDTPTKWSVSVQIDQ